MKKIKLFVNSQHLVPGGDLAPILGQQGINAKLFCDFVNAKSMLVYKDLYIPLNIIVYNDKTVSIKIKMLTLRALFFDFYKSSVPVLDFYKIILIYTWIYGKSFSSMLYFFKDYIVRNKIVILYE